MVVDYEQDLILVTCASGKQASHLLPHLSQKFKRLRLACNSPTSAERLRKQYPDAEVVQTNLEEPSSCRILLHNVTTVFHVGPSFHPHETEIGYNMIDAAVAESQMATTETTTTTTAQARSSTFQHFVYSSVLQSVFRKMLNHDRKRYVEEYLMETDLKWTIVQPGHFMDMMAPTVGGFATSTEPELVFTASWNPQTCFSCLALRDLGEAVARIVEQRDRHFFALYPLVSVQAPMSYAEMLGVVERVVGKPVAVRQRPFYEAVAVLLKVLSGGVRELDPRTAMAAERMLLFYNRRGLVGNPAVLEMVLGRKPTAYEDWVRGVIEDAKN